MAIADNTQLKEGVIVLAMQFWEDRHILNL